MLFPEARIIGGAGLGDIAKWTVATVAGLGAYDSVAGATVLKQLQPNANSTTVNTAVGANLTFVFQITGTPAPPKSWQIVGSIPGGLIHTNSVGFTTDSITGIPNTAGTYPITIRAWQNAGNTGSSFPGNFSLVVGPAIITTHPASVLIPSSGTATLTVSTSSGGTTTYQWYQGTTPDVTKPVASATLASFTTPPLTSATKYWVRVTRSAIVSDSGTATVSVGTAPAITTQPVSQTINSGSTLTLTVSASGTAPTFQWYRGAAGVTTDPVPGATSASFTIPALSVDTTYWARATNGLGTSDSSAATIQIRIAPALTTQPLSKSIQSGESTVLTVAANGTSPLFQWYVGTAGDVSNPIAGATAASFSTPILTSSKTYWVRVSNPAGFVNSDNVVVSVAVSDPYAEWKSNQFSASQLLDATVSGPTADPDGDGLSNHHEYVFGSQAHAANPPPALHTSLTGGLFHLDFVAVPTTGPGYSGVVRHYSLESAAKPGQVSWTPQPGFEDIVATGQNVDFVKAAAAGQTFYRLRVWLTP